MFNYSIYKFSSFFLLMFSFFFLCFGFYFFFYNYMFILDWEFFCLNSSYMTMTLIFDWMSMIFIGCVFLISSMVLFYSYSYMSGDLNSVRFAFLVILFIFSMFMMIISPNLISILIGWDGLGLVSYCLVIYFQNYNSYNAGLLTILTNRLGDSAILLSISWLMNFGSWSFFIYGYYYNNWLFYVFFLIVFASFTKSAQIPFSSWLPAAMAAPTPVSALVHSSTLVTAGVYLIIRYSDFILDYNCNFLIVLSLMTMFMSGLGANFEFDLKKIIALSTLSQLGLMMTIIFMGFPILSFFHLITHAFFKALLFLCAGLIIHIMNDSQDIRHMGGLCSSIPITFSCFFISNLSLCGFPFLAGFYSKDLILELCSFTNDNIIYYLVMYFSVMLTVSYTFRLFMYCIFSTPNCYSFQMYFEDNYMTYSMFILVLMAIFSGSLFNWLIFITPCFIMMSFYMKILSLISVILGGFMGFFLTFINFMEYSYFLKYYYLINYFGSMWFLPSFSTYFLSSSFMKTSFFMFSSVEMGWGEFLISRSHLLFIIMMTKFNQFFYYNNLKLYMIFFFLFVLFVMV